MGKSLSVIGWSDVHAYMASLEQQSGGRCDVLIAPRPASDGPRLTVSLFLMVPRLTGPGLPLGITVDGEMYAESGEVMTSLLYRLCHEADKLLTARFAQMGLELA